MSARPSTARSIQLLTVACVMAALAGCESTSSPDSAGDTAAPMDLSDRIVLGMTEDRVRAELGTPDKVDAGTMENRMEDTWHYSIELPPSYKTIVAEVREVPWVDPISGEMKSIPDPVVDQQRIDRREELKLTFRHNQLIAIDRTTSEQREFSR